MSEDVLKDDTHYRKILLAKEASQPDLIVDAVPLSVYKMRNGLSKTKPWKPNQNNVLGDWEDYKEIERLFGGNGDNEVEEQIPPIISIDEPVESQNLKEIKKYERECKEKEKRKEQDRIKKLFVFQRYRELREERALDNWKRHSIEWAKMEERLASKSHRVLLINQNPENLVMKRLGEFRQSVESKKLLEEALLLMEQENIDFWREGLRIGNDLLGLYIKIPRGGPRQIENIYYKGQPKLPRKESEYLISRQAELEQLISVLDPGHHHHGSYLELAGTSIDALKKMASDYVNRLEKSDIQKEPAVENNILPNEANEAKNDLNLLVSSSRLVFETRKEMVSKSLLTVYNTGNSAIHFEWVKKDKPNYFNTNLQSWEHQKFFFTYTSGVIKPGSAFDFPIVFRSTSTGIYTDIWELVTMPVLPLEQQIKVTLQGIVTKPDTLKFKRDEIDRRIHRKLASTAAQQIVNMILDKVDKYRPKIAPNVDSGFIEFIKENKKYLLDPPESMYKYLAQFWKSLPVQPAPWDYTIDSIYNRISEIETDKKSKAIQDLNGIVTNYGLQKTGLISSIINQILIQSSLLIVDFSEDIRKELGLPPAPRSFEPKEVVEEVEVKGKKPVKPVKEVKKKPEVEEQKSVKKEWNRERRLREYQYKDQLKSKIRSQLLVGFLPFSSE